MDKLKTDLNFKIQTEGFEVIGQGEIPTKPVQIGGWWVMPAELYTGKIPTDIQQRMFSLINSGMEVEGFLIAEDMRLIEERQKQEAQKKEARDKALKTFTQAALAAMILPLIGLGFGLLAILAGLWAYDPLLIAVTKGDQKWVALGEWFD